MALTVEELKSQLDVLKAKVDSITTPTHAQVVKTFSDATTAWQGYLTQQRRLLAGTSNEVITVPAGQPAPGWYPVTDPSGITTWTPSAARQAQDLAGFPTLALTGANGYTATLEHNNKFVYVYNNGNTQTNITIPTGLGANFNAIYLWMGNHTTMSIFSATGVTMYTPQASASITNARLRQRYGHALVVAPSANTIVVSGDLLG
jgi:hypothetical protein